MHQAAGDQMEDIQAAFEKLQPIMRSAFNGLGKGPVTPQIVRFYNAFDKLTAQSSTPISCKAGCTYCCYYHVMVSATEVFGIVEAIERMPGAIRESIKNRIVDVAALTKTMTSNEYIRTNVECAMLLDGKCSVYAARPVACRGHHSGDVAICKETFDDAHSLALAPKDYHREVIFRAFDNGQLAANIHAGVDATKYELHAALSAALDNPKAMKRWKDGKAAFPDVVDKVTLAQMMQNT